jgi:thiosulfate/3-mercaptopyruvate sulfurtransferase
MGKLIRIWALWLAASLPLFALPCSAADDGLRGHLASVDWLKKNLTQPDLVLVDASPAPLHRQRHIPGAILSTLFTFGPKDPPVEQIEAQLRSWGVGPTHRIVLYDQGGTYMATRLFWDLVHRGLSPERLSILDGGLSKWQAEGGAVTQDATPRPQPGTVRLTTVNPDVRVRLPEFLAATADPRSHVMLEALPPSYFYGGAAFFNRGGHVPHATLMPSDDFFNADKTFKSPQEIQHMVDHLGIRREQQVLTYCGGGGAAAVPFFALKYLLGYPQVRMFQESQMGWLQDERELPLWTYADPHLVRDTPWLKSWASPMLRSFGLQQVSVVDVRPADAFQLGHVPLAVNLPAPVLSAQRQRPAALAALVAQAGVDRSHEAVVVSEGGLNENAALVFMLLESIGQKKVSIFMDSIERWAELGHEVARPAAPASAGSPAVAAAPPAAPPAAPARSGLFVSDLARSEGLFPKVYLASGARLPARTPEGRVLHLPYTQFLNADGTPRAAKDIWNTLAKAGVPRYAEIVVFADTPGEAAVNYVILRMMGFAGVKLWAP